MTPDIMDLDDGPSKPPSRRPDPARNGTHPVPASRADEAHLLACCLLDDGATFDRATAAGVTAASFHYPEHAAVHLALSRLRRDRLPLDPEQLASRAADLLANVSPLLLVELTDPSRYPTTVHAGRMIASVTELAHRRALQRHAISTLEQIDRGAAAPDLPEPPEPPSKTAALTAQSATSFTVPLPGDPSILIGDRWLSRGDGAVLSSTSGMGKSSISLQLAYHWALELSPFGAFKPNGALTSLIFQAEDSDGDVGEVNHSLIHAMKLTPEQVQTVGKRVKIVTDRVNRGVAFATELRRQVELHKPDLVWINPLQAFIDGDVKESKDLGDFLRSHLNGINHPARFAYFIIHHTTKPPQEKKERQWNEVMYDMAGGAEIINWARAIISLRASEAEGEFKMVLAKRGRRAGATEMVKSSFGGEHPTPTTTISLRHSKERITFPGHTQQMPLLFWEKGEASQNPGKNKGGRRPKYDPQDMIACVPGPDQPAQAVSVIHRRVGELPCSIDIRTFKDWMAKWIETGEVLRTEHPQLGYVFRRAH